MPRFLAGEAQRRAETVATAIRISAPAHRAEAEQVLASSGGESVALPDDAIVDAWRALAREEGVFCEPASAAGVAALIAQPPPRGALVVCVVTGHGLKDPQAVDRIAGGPVPVDADPDAIAQAAGV